MERFLERQDKKNAGPTRKNSKPEKDLVQKPCMKWMRERGWSVNVFEAKATWSAARGRYISQSVPAGTCDCMGNMPDGHGVAIEFKAPGRLVTFCDNEVQEEFLKNKVDGGVFACVVDSVERLAEIYEAWAPLKASNDMTRAKEYLRLMLPKKRT